MNISIAEKFGTDISSRRCGAALREQLDALSGECVLDFTGVRTISSSFADEVFGVLFLSHGEQWFRSRIRIAGAEESIRLAILSVICERSEVAV